MLAAAGLVAVGAAPTATVPRFNHVVVVIMERHSPADIYGSASAPYINGSLIPNGVEFTNSNTPPGMHPGQPNHIALFAGSNLEITSDSCPQTLTGSNLAQQLSDAGMSFAQYSENLPSAGDTSCSSGGSGFYQRMHNPVPDFASLPVAMNQPYSQFVVDLNNGTLPTVSFVVPNVCNGMYGQTFGLDCPMGITNLVQVGDTWLSNNLPALFAAPIARNTLLILTWDEGSGLISPSDSIPTILAGAHVLRGVASTALITHYNVLRTLEDMYGLTPLRYAADASAIADVWDDVVFADMFE
jgi:acid phosphatase